MSSFNIRLDDIGKKYYQRWIFKDINFDFAENRHLALVGKNGSGKSTLLRVISRQLTPSIGKVVYENEANEIPVNHSYRYLSWSGPHVQPYLDLNLEEHIRLHFSLKTPILKKPQEMVSILNLVAHKEKPLRYFSSGMLQRVKVGLALFTKSEVLMLDEPTSNMDVENAAFMLDLIKQHLGGRIFVLASNMEREYASFDQIIRLKGN